MKVAAPREAIFSDFDVDTHARRVTHRATGMWWFVPYWMRREPPADAGPLLNGGDRRGVEDRSDLGRAALAAARSAGMVLRAEAA